MMVEGFSYAFFEKAASYIRSRLREVPETAIVLGTGCAPIGGKIQNQTVIPYSEIPGFPTCTNPSHRGELIAGDMAGKYVLCMNGRFHFYEGFSMEELSIPVHVLHTLGVKTLVLTFAVGSCNPSFVPGDAMVITDHIKLYGGSPMRGPNVPELGPRFFGVTDLYSKALRKIALEKAKEAEIRVHEGVYMFFPG
ncbi:MAG: purine-nucleoside phosphorylase, partial [Spirochaetales bacterium]|nr:purine-nucleoside phosphorylase [Candidatus Physcosoma equi]